MSLITLANAQHETKEKREFNVDMQTDCYLATEMLADAIATDKILTDVIFDIGIKSLKNPLSPSIPFQTTLIDQKAASLFIDFYSNRLITVFQWEAKEVQLSIALGIMVDIAEIFSDIQSVETKLKLPEKIIEDHTLEKIENSSSELEKKKEELSLALDSSLLSDVELKIDGKARIAFFPSNARVVLTTSSRGPRSYSLEVIKNCKHLFNPKFILAISPLMDLNPHYFHLGIHKLYLGRCILGLSRDVLTKSSYSVKAERELVRMTTLIQKPGFEFYTDPMM